MLRAFFPSGLDAVKSGAGAVGASGQASEDALWAAALADPATEAAAVRASRHPMALLGRRRGLLVLPRGVP